MNAWEQVLLEPARIIRAEIVQFLINIALVLAILVIGWIIAKAVGTLVTRGLRVLKLDELSDRIEIDSLLEKGGITYSLSELIGVVAYWLVLLFTFLVAINAVGLTIAADLLNKVILYVPNVVAAIFILILGLFMATLLKNIVKTAANNAGILQSNFLSKFVEVVIIAFAVILALEELHIGVHITELTVAIVLGSIGLGAALAFGLGCKDLAGKLMTELVEKMKSSR